jgi:hypothetical protein
MKPFVVAAFKDRSGAESALDRLRGSGLATGAPRLHSAPDASNAALVEADEAVSGGFFGNAARLLDELMNTPPDATQATDYDDLARRKATLVSVEVDTAETGTAVADLLSAAGAERVSTLPQPGLDS